MSEPRPPLSLSARVAVVLSTAVLFAMLTGGFARLAGLAGVGQTAASPTQSPDPFAVTEAPPVGLPAGAATASGSLAPAADPDPASKPAPEPTPGQSTPAPETSTAPLAPSTTLPKTPAALPPMWPQTLPPPGQHTVVVHDIEPTPRWVLGLPGGINLVGGRFLAELEDLGWKTETVVTPSGITTVGSRNDERLSLVLRPGSSDLPSGWSSLEVIYQPKMPDFEVPPTSTTTPEQAARKGA